MLLGAEVRHAVPPPHHNEPRQIVKPGASPHKENPIHASASPHYLAELRIFPGMSVRTDPASQHRPWLR